MRNSPKEWCETDEINVDEIDRRARLQLNANNFPTLVYISNDLYRQLLITTGYSNTYDPSNTYGGPIVGINTSAGQLNVVPVHRLRNFLLVGRREDWQKLESEGIDPVFWNDQERARVDKTFEEVVLEDDKE